MQLKSLIDNIIDTVRAFCDDSGCDENVYYGIAHLLVDNGYGLAHATKKLWKPFKGWNGLYVRVRNNILRTLDKLGYKAHAIIMFGSMAVYGRGRDIDVLVFLDEPGKFDEIEVELKAAWDAKASLLHWPPLDPIVVSGYKPLWVNK